MFLFRTKMVFHFIPTNWIKLECVIVDQAVSQHGKFVKIWMVDSSRHGKSNSLKTNWSRPLAVSKNVDSRSSTNRHTYVLQLFVEKRTESRFVSSQRNARRAWFHAQSALRVSFQRLQQSTRENERRKGEEKRGREKGRYPGRRNAESGESRQAKVESFVQCHAKGAASSI